MTLPKDAVPDPHDDTLVASAVRAAAAAAMPGDECPDAEMLAMYAEGDLRDGSEHRLVDAHLTGCGRCQAIVAACVRAQPDRGPSSASPATSPSGGWISGWRWLVPAASVAAVAVVSVWLRTAPAPPSPADRFDAESQDALTVAPPSVPVGSATNRPAQPAAVSAAPAGSLASNLVRREQDAGLGAPPAASPPPAETTPPLAETFGQRDQRSGRAAPARERQVTLADASPPSVAKAVPPANPSAPADTPPSAPAREVPAGAAREASDADATSPGGDRREKATSAEARDRGAMPAANAAQAPPARADVGSPAILGAAAAETSAFRAPVADAAWRAAQGRVEHSTDAGATWQPVTSLGVRVVAVGPVSTNVCWAIGERAVLRTTDGRSWTRAATPSNEPLTSIAAPSATSAVVMTARGARWGTSDGGVTWQLVR